MAADLSPAAQSTSTTDASPMAVLKSATHDPRAALEEAVTQLDIARQQRTEVSSELYKYRLLVDELKEQRMTLQSELSRRLNSHKEDVERIQSLQKELDHLRSSFSEKQNEIIELSTRVQDLLSRVDSTEQQRELKAENELLWRKINEFKRAESNDPIEKAQLERWRDRFVEIETAISDAYQERRMAADIPFESCADMLQAILSAEEGLRRSLAAQLTSLKGELRSAKDQVEDLTRQATQSEVASVKLDVEMKKQVELYHKVQDLESERDSYSARIAHLKADLDRAKVETNRAVEEATRELAQKLAQALQTLNTKVEAMTALEANNRELRAQLDTLSGSNRESTRVLAETNSMLEARTASLSSVIKALEADMSTQAQKLDVEVAANRFLTEANSSLQAEIENLRNAATRESDKNEESLRHRLGELEDEIATARMSADARILEATQRAQFIEELNDRLKESKCLLESQFERVSAELRDKKVEIEAAKDELSQQQEEISELRRHLAAAQQNHDRSITVGQSKKAQDDLQAQLALLEAQHRATLEDVEIAEHRHNQEIAKLQSELNDLHKVVQAKTEELLETSEALQSARADLEALEKLEESRIGLQNQVSNQEEELERLRSELSAAEERMSKMQDAKREEEQLEIASLQEAKKKVETRVIELEELLTTQQTQIEELKESLQEALNGPAVESLMADNFKTCSEEQRINKLKAALNKATATAKEQENLAEIARERAKEKQNEVDQLKRQIHRVEEGWKVEYDGYLSNLHRINTALEKANEERTRLESELQKAKAAAARTRAANIEVTDGEREKWNKERRTFEKSLDETKRKLVKAQKEAADRTAQAKRLDELHKRVKSQPRGSLGARTLTIAIAGGLLTCWLSFVLGVLTN